MMMNKRGQGLSITTIIVAALALIVLVVLVAIFTGRLGGFSKGVAETITCQNSCKAFGMDFDYTSSKADCDSNPIRRYVPGNYPDVEKFGKGTKCCCRPEQE